MRKLYQKTKAPIGALLSGGLDSAVLLADEASRDTVQPIYIGAGLAWEAAERATVARLLESADLRQRLGTPTARHRNVEISLKWRA